MYLRSLIGKDDADAVMLMSKRNKKNCQKASIGYFCDFAVVLLFNNSRQLLFLHLFYDFNEPGFLTNATVVEDATILLN